MGLIPSNHHVIFVTDVVVATWYVDILVAQPKEPIQHHGPVFFYTIPLCIAHPHWMYIYAVDGHMGG